MVSRLSKCCAKFFFGISTVSSFLSTSLPHEHRQLVPDMSTVSSFLFTSLPKLKHDVFGKL